MEGPEPHVVSVRAPRVATGLLAAARAAPVVTSEGALLANVPQRFLSPQIRTILASQMREGSVQTDSCCVHLNFGFSSQPVTQPPPHFRLLQTQLEASLFQISGAAATGGNSCCN